MTTQQPERIEVWTNIGTKVYCSVLKKNVAESFFKSPNSNAYRTRDEAIRASQGLNEQPN